jgi:hypothetical protein
VEALGPVNPPITDLSVPILVQVVPPRVTPYEHQIVLQEAMEENVATSSGSPHTPLMTATTGGILPPNPPSLVWTTVVSTPSTSGSGLIPSVVMTTAPFTQSATGPPFSYGMPTLIRTLSLPTPPYRPWVWGQGAQTLPCKGPWGAPQPPITLSLMVGVIYLLCPPRSWCFPATRRAEHELQLVWSRQSRTFFLHHVGGIHVILFV